MALDLLQCIEDNTYENEQRCATEEACELGLNVKQTCQYRENCYTSKEQ
jgi:hypothetical protein